MLLSNLYLSSAEFSTYKIMIDKTSSNEYGKREFFGYLFDYLIMILLQTVLFK